MAIKFVRIVDPSRTDAKSIARARRIDREIDVMLHLRHRPHIVSLESVWRCGTKIAMVMEWASGGELFEHVQRRKRLREDEARAVMRQIVDAVQCIHEAGFVHRDLKLENVLISEGMRVLVTDFGFAAPFMGEAGEKLDSRQDEWKRLTTSCGSPCYAAPELVLEREGYYGPPVDIWSCGVILFAMLMGHLPFEDDASRHYSPLMQHKDGSAVAGAEASTTGSIMNNVYQLYQFIAGTRAAFRVPRSLNLSVAVQDLLARMLEVDPQMRITISEIKAHPWFIAGEAAHRIQ